MYPIDLWIPQDIDINSLKNEMSKHRWKRSWGGLRVNILFENKDHSLMIEKLISTIRLTRVGHDARHPHINLWLDINKATDEFLKSIMQMDNSIPRLNAFLIHRNNNPNIAFLKSVLDRLKCNKISSKLLILLPDDQDIQVSALEHVEVISEANIMSDVIFEHFPACGVEAETPIINKLLAQLKEKGYDFSSHPLSLCGVVASVCKMIFLGHFPKATQNITLSQDKSPFSNLADLPCALEGIRYCYKASDSLEHLNCGCDLSFSNILVEEAISSHIISQYNDPNDYILFEDWQYIYDGFKMV